MKMNKILKYKFVSLKNLMYVNQYMQKKRIM